MNKLLCVPITETSADHFLSAIDEAANIADIIELRLDYLPDPELTKVLAALLTQKLTKPLLFTFRPQEQGGKRDVSLEMRLNFWRGLQPEILS